jgi:hypothetical protein
MQCLARVVLAAFALTAVPSTTSAITFDVTFRLGDDVVTLADLTAAAPLSSATHPSGGTRYFYGSSFVKSDDWSLNGFSAVEGAFFSSGDFSFTNLSDEIQVFELSMVTAIAPIPTPTRHITFAQPTVQDLGDGAASASNAPGQPLFTGSIDGNEVLTLFPGGFSIACAVSFCQVTPLGSESILSNVPGPPALVSMGTRMAVAVAPGDRIRLFSNWSVFPIPEPTTLTLVAAGIAALAIRSRARRAA